MIVIIAMRDHWTGPGFGIVMNDKNCTEIKAMYPRTLVDWRSNPVAIAQVLWSDIAIYEMPSHHRFEHARGGPVQIGDTVCGVAFNQSWVYIPDDVEVAELCNPHVWTNCRTATGAQG